MSLRSQPSVTRHDIVTVQVVAQQPVDPDNERKGYGWFAYGRPTQVISRKLGAAESFREGKTQTDVNYTLYAEYRPGTIYPVTEKMYIWHPEFSRRNEDGTQDYSDRLLEVSSVVAHNRDKLVQAECGGSY